MGHESGDHRDLKIRKLRAGSYFSDCLLDTRTLSERGFIQVVAEVYVGGVSARRVVTVLAKVSCKDNVRRRIRSSLCNWPATLWPAVTPHSPPD